MPKNALTGSQGPCFPAGCAATIQALYPVEDSKGQPFLPEDNLQLRYYDRPIKGLAIVGTDRRAVATIMCAEADLPAPDYKNLGGGMTSVMLPVYMNTSGASVVSLEKPRTACHKSAGVVDGNVLLKACRAIANVLFGEARKSRRRL